MTARDVQEREIILQCTVCRARVLRRGSVNADDVCPRCGQRGGWVELSATQTDTRRDWTDELADQIEGQSGAVKWQ